jgi:hypothetical protein
LYNPVRLLKFHRVGASHSTIAHTIQSYLWPQHAPSPARPVAATTLCT